jgi:hypothetical protein
MAKIVYTSAEAADKGIAPCEGYDGVGYTIGDRVELHPGMDLWMRGARYGRVVALSLTPRDRVRVTLDRLFGERTISGAEDRFRLACKAEPQ